MKKIEDRLIDISKKIEVPTNILRNVSKIEIIAHDTISIENHKGILHYDDTNIDINCGDFIARISGFDLNLGTMDNTFLTIFGNIQNIDFTR